MEKLEDKLLVVTAEVTKGFLPVLNTAVTGIVTQDGEELELPLKDDGIGNFF